MTRIHYRYSINGFVEELPQLLESRYRHACAALPVTGVGSNCLIWMEHYLNTLSLSVSKGRSQKKFKVRIIGILNEKKLLLLAKKHFLKMCQKLGFGLIIEKNGLLHQWHKKAQIPPFRNWPSYGHHSRIFFNRAIVYHQCLSAYSNHLQALIVAGGQHAKSGLSTVLTLIPGATTWTQLASLPRQLSSPQASIVGGRLRLSGGIGISTRSEVITK